MVKPRQGQQKSELIIQTKVNWFRELISTIFSIAVWLYCIGVISFFFSALINYNDRYISLIKSAFKMTNSDIRSFLFIVFFIWTAFYIGLWSWKQYNKKRFGSLSRRSYPNHSTKEDLLNLQLMTEDDFHTLQQSRVVVFEKNPIKHF